MSQKDKIVVVTGANRGLGFETSRQLSERGFHVVLTSRSEEAGKRAAQSLSGKGGQVSFFPLDVSRAESIARLAEHLEKEYGRVDVLVNNAGIFDEDASADAVRNSFETNVLGPYQLCRKILPLMQKNGYGRVVNLSSGMGQLSEMNGGYPAYRISKTALNAVTRIFSEEFKNAGDIKVNSVCPGWVKTDMGGPNAEREPSEGADTVVWAATLPKDGPTGCFLRDREVIDW